MALVCLGQHQREEQRRGERERLRRLRGGGRGRVPQRRDGQEQQGRQPPDVRSRAQADEGPEVASQSVGVPAETKRNSFL